MLEIYSRLLNGSFVNKRDEAVRYGVNERSIQRDIDPGFSGNGHEGDSVFEVRMS